MANRNYKKLIEAFHKQSISVSEKGVFAGKITTNVYVEKQGKQVRVRKVFTSWKEAYEKLQKIYGLQGETLLSIFPRWLDWKTERNQNKRSTRSSNTIAFSKYVSGHRIASIPLMDLTAEDLNDWAHDVLKQKPLYAQRFNTYKIVVTGPLSYAVREGILEKNPWDKEKMDYQLLFKAKRKAPSNSKIFSPEETALILKDCLEGYTLNRNSCNIALMINFELGLRVGELSALKWSDIDWERKTIFIQRQESEHMVEEAVKSDSSAGYRELPLTDCALSLLNRLKTDFPKTPDGFIFVDESGARKTNKAIQMRLIHIQEKLNIVPLKRIHCQRRTVGTQIANGMGVDAARQWLGHTDLQTTLRYIYTDKTPDLMRAFMEQKGAFTHFYSLSTPEAKEKSA